MVDSQTRIKWSHNISVWPELKVNFWGITKAGNTSVKKALIKTSHPEVVAKQKAPADQWVHSLEYARYVTSDEALNNGYRNFTVVRNPTDRFVSMVKDCRKRPHIYNVRFQTVDQVLNFIEPIPDPQRNMHLRSQSYFLGYEVKEDLKIFKLENLTPLCEWLSIDIEHNNAIKDDITLSDLQLERVRKIFMKDYELLGY